MAQVTTLAAAAAAGTSTDIVIAAGASVTLGIYTSDAGGLPGDAHIDIYIDTPSADKFYFALTPNAPAKVIAGPCTLRGKKLVSAVAYGLFHET